MSARQVVLIGCNYVGSDGADVRREPGDIVEDLPEAAVAALTAAGAVATEEALAASAEAPAVEAPATSVFHAVDGKVHHTRADCPVGNNVEPQTRVDGNGGLKKCRDCTRLERGEKE